MTRTAEQDAAGEAQAKRLVAAISSGELARIPSDGKCECGVAAGQLHHRYCDGEECPACGNQLITCEVLGCDRTGL